MSTEKYATAALIILLTITPSFGGEQPTSIGANHIGKVLSAEEVAAKEGLVSGFQIVGRSGRPVRLESQSVSVTHTCSTIRHSNGEAVCKIYKKCMESGVGDGTYRSYFGHLDEFPKVRVEFGFSLRGGQTLVQFTPETRASAPEQFLSQLENKINLVKCDDRLDGLGGSYAIEFTKGHGHNNSLQRTP